jgi:sigma-B regulation protein RsbU (phosphoserine phosphatase)
MKFKTALTLTLLVLIAVIVSAIVVGIGIVIDRSATAKLRDDLGRARLVFLELQDYRQSLCRAQARTMADEPRLRAVMATPDVDAQTVTDVAAELEKASGMALFVVTDEEGLILADVADPDAAGHDLSTNTVVETARERGEASGIWVRDREVFQVEARRIAMGRSTLGLVVVGYPIDDKLARSFAAQTSMSVVIELDGRPIASAFAGDEGRPAQTAGDRDTSPEDGVILASLTSPMTEPATVSLGGRRFLAAPHAFPAYTGAASLRFTLLASLDAALEPGHRLIRVVVVVALVSVIAAWLLSLLASARFSRPVDELVRFTEKVASGDLESRSQVAGVRELSILGGAMNRMVEELAASRNQLVAKKRLEKEMEIATRIQTALLPRRLDVPGFEISAQMIPASEVGGDYYDVFLATDGCWVGIGDVAGHGLPAGIIMLMMQSVVTALGGGRPEPSPKELVINLNHALVENIRNRLESDEHATFAIFRCHEDGRVTSAGAHECVIIVRGHNGDCELITTRGPWLGVSFDVETGVCESHFALEPGDLMVLYSDGITETMSSTREQYQVERLCDAVREHRHESTERIRDTIMSSVEAWGPGRDDRTLVVLRYLGPRAG